MPWLTTEGTPFLPVLFAVGLAFVSLALGRRLLVLIGASRCGSALERGIVALGLGVATLEYVPFTLGAAGVLGIRSLRVAAVLVILAAAYDLRYVAMAVPRAVRSLLGANPWVKVWAAALLPALVIAGLLAMTPTTDPDGMGYHLTVPKRWLESGRLEYLPTYPYSNAPMGVEMLFAFGMAIAGDEAAKCIHFTLGAAAAVGLYLAGKRLRGPTAGAVAATLFLVGPLGVVGVLGWAYVEGVASFAMVSASVAWLWWYDAREPAALRCAALLAGVAVTFKITSLLFPIGLVALTFVALLEGARLDGRRLLSATTSILRLVPLVLLPIIPWMTRSLIVTGNPVYPVLARLIPSRDFSPDLSAKFDRHNRLMTWGNAAGRSLTMEQRSLVLLAVCTTLLVVGTLAFIRVRSWMARGTVVVATLITLIQVGAAGLYIRYSIPLAAVLVLPILAGIPSLLSRRAIPAVLIGVTLAASLFQARRSAAQMDSDVMGLVRTALGLEGRKEFLLRHLPIFPLFEDANAVLPPGAGVMLSCACPGFYIDRRTFCAEMVQDSLRFGSWESFTADLQRLGITHVVAPVVLATGGPPPPPPWSSVSMITHDDQVRVVRRLLGEYGRPLATSVDQGLYEIDMARLSAAR